MNMHPVMRTKRINFKCNLAYSRYAPRNIIYCICINDILSGSLLFVALLKATTWTLLWLQSTSRTQG